jgi:hypothetical protein
MDLLLLNCRNTFLKDQSGKAAGSVVKYTKLGVIKFMFVLQRNNTECPKTF